MSRRRTQCPRRAEASILLLRTVSLPYDTSPAQRSLLASFDNRFAEAAQQVLVDGRTLLRLDRLWILWQAVSNVRLLGLPAAEVGTYRGGSAFFIASAFGRLSRVPTPIEAIDTFKGHPNNDPSSADHPIHVAGHFSDTSFTEVCEYLARFPNLTLRRGRFAEVAPQLPHQRYGFVHVDIDLYKPTTAALKYFGPRLAVGGVIVLDDYGADKCPGVRKAADEFLRDRRDFQSWHPYTEQLVLVRVRLER
jgi:Macrocin-O-methyltransferase (TylF)